MKQVFFLEGFQWSEIDAHHDDEIIKFQIRCFGASFEIQYKFHNLSPSPNLLEQFRSSLAIMRAYETGDNLDAERASEEILCLKKPFEKIMIELAPTSSPSLSHHLSDYLYSPLLMLEAIATTRDSIIIEPHFKGQLPRQIRFPAGQYIPTSADWLDLVKSSTSQQIRLPISSNLEQHPCVRGPTKVIAEDGAICYYKELPQWLSPLSTVTEAKPWIHTQIPAAIEAKKLHSDIHICRLHSVIIDDDRKVLQHWVRATEKDLIDIWENDGSDDWTL
ncbi:hypothetical protein SBOR_7959 [Sclerotinia borealis F-4128]|uniref:Uncharacterized protein n=1 Tax=Sclerotinia borealis (strain F-4128) TaxID=1432307 RepID=W9C724_SCLBF|nr:hypothetical protein SBOR_7959 [Sclerotinia borealis F-4128]